MKYEIQIEKRAKKFIASQDPKQRERIIKAISLLPVSGDIKPLKGSDNFFRLRVGSIRILYTLKPKTNEITIVLVTDAGNRGQIYNGV